MKLKSKLKVFVALLATIVFSISMAVPAIPTFADPQQPPQTTSGQLDISFQNTNGGGKVQYSTDGTSFTDVTTAVTVSSLSGNVTLKIVPDSGYIIDWTATTLTVGQDFYSLNSGDSAMANVRAALSSAGGYTASVENGIILSGVEFKVDDGQGSGGGGGPQGGTNATISFTVKDSTARPSASDLQEGEEAPGHLEFHGNDDPDAVHGYSVGFENQRNRISSNDATYLIGQVGTFESTSTTSDISGYSKANDDSLVNGNNVVVGVKTTTPFQTSYNYDGSSATVALNIHQGGGDIITKLLVNGVDYTSQVPTTIQARSSAFSIENGRDISFNVNVAHAANEEYNIEIEARPVTYAEAILGNFGWCYNENGSASDDDKIAHGTIEFIQAEYNNEIITSVADVNAKYTNHEGIFQWQEATKKASYDGNNDPAAFGEALFPPGTKITVKLVPDPGYQLVEFTLNGFEVTPGDDNEIGYYTFDFHPGNFHLGAVFEEVENDVAIESTQITDGAIDLATNEAAIEIGTAKLEVVDTEVSASQTEAFTEQAQDGGYEIENYLDISLFNTVYKGGQTDNQGNLLTWDTPLERLSANATVFLQLEEDMSGKEVVLIHETHEGNTITGYETIPCEYLAEYNAIVFETDSFSNYAVATKDLVEYKVVDKTTGIELTFTDGEGHSYIAEINDFLNLSSSELQELGISQAEYNEIIGKIKSNTLDFGTLLKLLDINVVDENTGEYYEGAVDIKIPLTAEMKAKYNSFKMVFIDGDNGYAAGDAVSLKIEGDYLVGKLPHLSLYAITGEWVEQNATPQTGDPMNTFLMMFTLGGGTLVATIAVKKKSRGSLN